MIELRPARPEDADAIAAIYAPHVLGGTASFETEAPDAGAIRARMAGADGAYPWLVATAGDGEVLAYAYAAAYGSRPAYGWAVETTIYVAGAAQRQGAGRLLYRALIDTLRAQRFTTAVARIALPNDASIRLHERTGFREIGVLRHIGWKHGRWIDVGLWQCDLADLAGPPLAPRLFAEIGLVRG